MAKKIFKLDLTCEQYDATMTDSFGSPAACRHRITQPAAVRGTAEVQIRLYPSLDGQH